MKTLSLYYDRGLITESFQVSQDFVQKVNNFMPNKTNVLNVSMKIKIAMFWQKYKH